MRGASARPFNPRAFIRDAISAPGRHAPSLAPPPLVKTSCFHCSKCHNLNLKTDRGFVFCFLGLTLSGTLFFSRIEECRLGFADRDVGERTEEPGWRLPFVPLNRNDEMREPAERAGRWCQAEVLEGGDWPSNSDACTEVM